MGSTDHLSSTGYGPSTLPLRNPLMFTGKEEDYDIWETRFLGYMAIKDLKQTILPSTSEADAGNNDANNNGRDALSLLRDHYRGFVKPRILTMHTNICKLK